LLLVGPDVRDAARDRHLPSAAVAGLGGHTPSEGAGPAKVARRGTRPWTDHGRHRDLSF
jgi:hypothetical protein